MTRFKKSVTKKSLSPRHRHSQRAGRWGVFATHKSMNGKKCPSDNTTKTPFHVQGILDKLEISKEQRKRQEITANLETIKDRIRRVILLTAHLVS